MPKAYNCKEKELNWYNRDSCFFKKTIVVDIGIDYLSQSNSINLFINSKNIYYAFQP
jgi:hypothetical protein